MQGGEGEREIKHSVCRDEDGKGGWRSKTLDVDWRSAFCKSTGTEPCQNTPIFPFFWLLKRY